MCTRCGTEKDLDEFYTGRNQCKVCLDFSAKRWRAENRGRYLENTLKWNVANSEKRRESKLKDRYKINLVEYNQMFSDQNGVCKICAHPETIVDKRNGKIRPLSVDHDHLTGEIRGLLCNACNTGIARFKDDPKVLRAATKYLEDNSDE